MNAIENWSLPLHGTAVESSDGVTKAGGKNVKNGHQDQPAGAATTYSLHACVAGNDVRNEDLEYRSFLERPRYNSAVWSVKGRGTHTNVSRVSRKLKIGSCRIWFLSIYFLHAFCLPCTPYKKNEPCGCNDPLKPPIILPSFASMVST